MKSSVIYYTDNRLEDPLYSFVQDRIADSGLPIFSASLEPIDFGFNEVIKVILVNGSLSLRLILIKESGSFSPLASIAS